MKSLVLGSDSFMGNYLINYIRDIKKENVIEFAFSNSADNSKNSSIRVLDINDRSAIEKTLQEFSPNKIYCLDMIDSISYVWDHPKEAIESHIKGTINLLEAIKTVDKSISIFFTGSSDEYKFEGFNNIPVSEKTSLEPLNVYAVSKSCQNMIAQVYAKAYGLNVVIGRIFNNIGAGQTENFVLSSICKQAIEIKKGISKDNSIHVGNINSSRDFIDVRDSVEAIYYLLEFGKPNEIYNIANNKSFTIRELIKKIEKLTNNSYKIIIDNKKIRLNDIPIIQGDISKITNQTGWIPKINIDETIEWMLAYWDEGTSY